MSSRVAPDQLPSPMYVRWALGLLIVAMLMGMLVATGATAAMIFPTIKKIGVQVPAWASDPKAWMLVAGLPMQKAFTLGDWATAVGVLLAFIFVSPRKGERPTRSMGYTWIGLLTLGIVTMAEFFLHARMDAILQDIQSANAGGRPIESGQRHAEFAEWHPIATGLMGARFLLLMFIAMLMLVVLSRCSGRAETWKAAA